MTINIPPLRDRREEIPLLVEHFLRKYSVQYNKPVSEISRDLHELFAGYEWPGNVRQLENLIKRMVVLGTESAIVKELQQPAATLSFRPQSAPSFAPRPFVAPPPPPVMPPPAAAGGTEARALATPSATHAGATEAEPMSAAVTAAVAATVKSGSVSLKDIARTAAREAEREMILRMLTRTRWNRKEAAEILGISYKALLYKIKESGLDKAS